MPKNILMAFALMLGPAVPFANDGALLAVPEPQEPEDEQTAALRREIAGFLPELKQDVPASVAVRSRAALEKIVRAAKPLPRKLLRDMADGQTDPGVKKALLDLSDALTPLALSLAVKGSPKAGKPLEYAVRLSNLSDEDILFVSSLDGSCFKRYPLFHFEARDANGNPVAMPKVRACGNVNRLRVEDFTFLAPGASVNPVGPGSFGQVFMEMWEPAAGKYALKLTLDYSSANRADWDPGLAGKPDIALDRLVQLMPKLRLEAETKVEVLP